MENISRAYYNSYRYTDGYATSGVNYYRIKQVDSDGDYDYMETRSAFIQTDEKDIILYPNPTENVI